MGDGAVRRPPVGPGFGVVAAAAAIARIRIVDPALPFRSRPGSCTGMTIGILRP
jgi:hypothetical protein